MKLLITTILCAFFSISAFAKIENNNQAPARWSKMSLPLQIVIDRGLVQTDEDLNELNQIVENWMVDIRLPMRIINPLTIGYVPRYTNWNNYNDGLMTIGYGANWNADRRFSSVTQWFGFVQQNPVSLEFYTNLTHGDIIINPDVQVSLDGSEGTYDLGSIIARQLGFMMGLKTLPKDADSIMSSTQLVPGEEKRMPTAVDRHNLWMKYRTY